MDRLLAVTPEDVKAAVTKYLGKDKVAHLRVLPPPPVKPEAKPEKEKGEKTEKTEKKPVEKKETK